MKPPRLSAAWACFLFAMAVSLPAQQTESARLRPPYVPDELLISITEDTTVAATPGKTRADLLVAMGATLVDEQQAGTQPFLHVRLLPGGKLGRAFRVAQTFDFGTPPRWTVVSVQPNFIYFPAVVGGTPPGGNRLFNFSARAEVGAGEGVTIGGLVIPGEFARPVIFKVRGPSLSAFGVAHPLANPVLRIYEGSQLILQNDDWTSLRSWEKDYGPTPDHPLEPKIMTYLDPGIYTAIVSGAAGGTGVALLETYLVDIFYVY